MPTGQLMHRPARIADLDEVVGFPRSADELFYCFPRATWPLTLDQLAEAVAQRRDSQVALYDGRLAGFVNFYQWAEGESCTLGNLMVAGWAREHGVASYLVGVMEDLARRHYHAQRLKLSCFNGNASGLLFYTRLGYRPTGIVERRDRHDERVALIQLEKSLEPA
ncbi:MAG: hypothetical protein GAK43_02267 [Stenotrophomonas maltophilia]|nr:MAG: hypothetical protein GAK43_02267 [Stenotrophomonas maltophilia]